MNIRKKQLEPELSELIKASKQMSDIDHKIESLKYEHEQWEDRVRSAIYKHINSLYPDHRFVLRVVVWDRYTDLSIRILEAEDRSMRNPLSYYINGAIGFNIIRNPYNYDVEKMLERCLNNMIDILKSINHDDFGSSVHSYPGEGEVFVDIIIENSEGEE